MKTKQHEDKYIHISKEVLKNLCIIVLWITFAAAIMLMLYGVGYSAGHDDGYKEGRDEVFNSIEYAFDQFDSVDIGLDSGIGLTCKEREPSYFDYGYPMDYNMLRGLD